MTLSVDGAGDTTSYVYNGMNELVLTINPDSSTISQVYDADGDMTKYIDSDNNTTSWAYNADDLATLVSNALGSNSTIYNGDGLATTIVDADGRTELFQYDGDENLTAETWIVSATVVNVMNYSYNPDGEMTLASNYEGTYSYTYNSDSFETQQIYTDADGDKMTLNYADDGDGNVTQMTDSQGDTILYSYDGDSELTTKRLH